MKRLSRRLALPLVAALFATPATWAQCPGADDPLEDNDTCLTAVPLALGSYPGLYVEKLDSDFYILDAQPGMYVVAKTLFIDDLGDIDIFLYDSACAGVLIQNTSATDDEGVAWLNTTGSVQSYVLEVQVWSGSALDCNTYDLIVENSVDPCTLPDDGFEENDSCGLAAGLTSGLTTGLYVDKFDLDYYELTVQPGDTLSASVLFCDALADIDITLYDPTIQCGGGSGTGLTEGTSNNDNESVSWTNMTAAPKTYVLEIYIWPPGVGDCNTYDVSITGTSGPIGTSYCGPAIPNSTGSPAFISAEGSAVTSENNVTLTVTMVPTGQFGYFLAGQTQGFFNPPGSTGFICLMGTIGRYNQAANIIMGPTGSITADLTSIPVSPPAAVQPGETWNFQCWYRDIAGTSNFSDGVSIAFQ